MTGREALARHPLAIAGALMATAAGVAFCALLIAAIAGLFRNPYAGLVIFVASPAAFVAGLLLVPLGMWLQRRRIRRTGDAAAAEWPVLDFRRPPVRRAVLVVLALTAVNLVIVLLAGYGGLRWMESPSFCGQVCHTPMHPQFTAWQAASHAGVACVACHVGEGPGALARAKLSGVRQLAHMVGDSYPTPIPPGVRMPPGTQARACAGCHQPMRDASDRIRVIRDYADDEGNSETTTILQMHLVASASSPRGIHWHADPANRIEYVATDEDRQTIPYVKMTDATGRVKEFVAPDATDELIRTGTRRTMDCIDCHNTVGHPISPTPERAVDRAIAAALVSRDLPYARREGLRLLKAEYPTQDAGVRAIEQGLHGFYESQSSASGRQSVARAVATLQDVYRRNVFPAMRVTWGTYPDSTGHFTSTGCFRCHDELHAAGDGSTISADCGYCHTQIEKPS